MIYLFILILQIEKMVEIEVEHITYTQLQSLKDEFSKLLDDNDDGESEELPFKVDYSYRRQLERKDILSQSEELIPTKDLLNMSKQDRKHVAVLGKFSDKNFTFPPIWKPKFSLICRYKTEIVFRKNA